MSTIQTTGRPAVQVSVGKSPTAEADHRRQLAQAINRASQGHINATLFVTLDPDVTKTVVVDSRISKQTGVSFMPQTANAAAAKAVLYATCTNGTMTINHASNTETDRTFTVTLIG